MQQNEPAKHYIPADYSANTTLDPPKDSVVPKMKICGLTQTEDIDAINNLSCELIPDYVGFVFYEQSKRAVSPEKARTLRTMLNSRITTVGVFVDAAIDDVAELFEAGTIAVAQLHGTEDEAYLQALRKRCPQLVIWKAFEITEDKNTTQHKDFVDQIDATANKEIALAQESNADLILLDAGKGSGTSFDWSCLVGIDRPFALAGGLNPENVVHALEQCAKIDVVPAVLDVSSGVEADERAKDGRTQKDPAKIVAFMEAVRDYCKQTTRQKNNSTEK